MTIQPFGTTKDDREAVKITLRNAHGASLSVTNFGATVVSLIVPDRDGHSIDVLLGYEDVSSYEKNGGYLGAAIGRVGNRIAGASFSLNGTDYALDANDGPQCLHGGSDGYDRRLWHYTLDETENRVIFSLISPHMDQGFPGQVMITVTYTLTEENELHIRYCAVPDRDTPINMTNHSYFNLNGHGDGSCLDHEAVIYADFMTESREGVYPNGNILAVRNTPFDFTSPHTFGERIDGDHPQLVLAGGYDHNYVLNDYRGQMRPIAKVRGPKTGITMEVLTDTPGMQLYTGNFIEDFTGGKDGVVYKKRSGFCMETQYFPDAVHYTHFPSVICRKGQVYESETVYRFTAAEK